MKKYKVFYLILILCNFVSLSAKYDTAYVNIDYERTLPGEITKLLFGNFIEYYMSFMNGPVGMWAQEYINRGFDIENSHEPGMAVGWAKWAQANYSESKWKIIEGGYNEKGLFFQRLNKNLNDSSIGIFQTIHATKKSGYDFYVYLRGDSTITDVRLKVMDKSLSTTLFETSLGKPGSDWRKFSAKLPPIDSLFQFSTVICSYGYGNLDIDESSIMPSNNVNGIRAEFFNYYYYWKPGVLRYPGGWFVEYSCYHWPMAVGPIDKREIRKGYENVRIDFGIDEYIKFCRDIGSEPHLTVNFLTGSPEEAASLVEYCNGSENSNYGSIRALNGHPEPYNVKIWEIGNEIWTEPIQYANGFVDFYKRMKSVDPSITCIIDGNIWGGRGFFDTLANIVGSNCDIYGYHWAQIAKPKSKVDDNEIYLSMVGGSQILEKDIDSVDKWINEKKMKETMNQGITEIWSEYNPDGYEWSFDTTKRGGSLENGLWMASIMNTVLRKSNIFKILEKTGSVGLIRTEFDKITGERIIYSTPVYLALAMARHHVGSKLLLATVKCKNYSTNYHEGLFNFKNVPWVDITVTYSTDSLFLSMINRNPNDTIISYLNLNQKFSKSKAKVYELSSTSYLDANTRNNPDFVKIKFKEWPIAEKYFLPPHSYTILAIPWVQNTSKVQDPESISYEVYPNPFDKYLIVKCSESIGIKEIIVSDHIGRILDKSNTRTNDGFFKINTSELHTGVYFLTIISNINRKVIPILKLSE